MRVLPALTATTSATRHPSVANRLTAPYFGTATERGIHEQGQSGHAAPKHSGMVDLYNSPSVYDAVILDQRGDTDFYTAQALQQKDPVLEVTAGTGRLTIPMAKQGIAMTGLDLSGAMLQEARVKAEKAGVSIPFIQGDATDFHLDQKFGMVMVPGSGVLLLDSKAALNRFLKCAKEHLLPGGKLVFDVLTPTSPITKLPSDFKHVSHNVPLPDGRDVEVRQQDCHYDPDKQIFRYSIVQHDPVTDQEIRKDVITFQLYDPAVLRECLRENGFQLVGEYGDFEHNPFQPDSLRQILVCRANPFAQAADTSTPKFPLSA